MRKKNCCFAGHDESYGENMKDKIKICAKKLIKDESVGIFMVGNYGGFDRIAASAIRSLKTKYQNIRLELIVPYLTAEIVAEKDWYIRQYDSVIIADIPESAPKRYGIIYANKYLVKKSDFMIAHIDHTYGGAYKTFLYAKRNGVDIIDI